MIIEDELYKKNEIVYLSNNELKFDEGEHNCISIPINHEHITKNSVNITNYNLIETFGQNADKVNTFEKDDINDEKLYFINKLQILDNKKNESTSTTDGKLKSEETFISKKRENDKKHKRKKEHSKFEKDNVMRKLNIHYISFIVKYVNYNIKRLISKKHPVFTNLCYEFKKRINNTSFNELKNKTIGELLKNEGSNKNKRNMIYPKNDNEKIFNSLYETSLKDLLDVNYIEFYREVYTCNPYKGQNVYGVFKQYKAPKDIIFFEDFLNNEEKKDNINGELYKKRLEYISKSEFINEGYPFFETKTIGKKKNIIFN